MWCLVTRHVGTDPWNSSMTMTGKFHNDNDECTTGIQNSKQDSHAEYCLCGILWISWILILHWALSTNQLQSPSTLFCGRIPRYVVTGFYLAEIILRFWPKQQNQHSVDNCRKDTRLYKLHGVLPETLDIQYIRSTFQQDVVQKMVLQTKFSKSFHLLLYSS